MSIRLETRECPGCHQVKPFPARNKVCSLECSALLQRKDYMPEVVSGQYSNVVSGNIWEVTLPETNIQTIDGLVKHFKIDLNIWRIDKFISRRNKVSQSSNGSYFLSARMVRMVDAANMAAAIEAMKRDYLKFARNAPKFPAIKRSSKKSGRVLELAIYDAHFGKLAWDRETGHHDYDVHIAEKYYNAAVAALLERTASYEFDEIIYVVGNDFLNSDNKDGTTTAGTPVTNDTRYQKVFEIGLRTLIQTITRLREIAPVRVVVVPGNHDALSSWHIGMALWCYFHECPDVTIDNDPKKYKYVQIGKCMLMFTHGDEGKLNEYHALMSSEQPKMWGETIYREAHTGDKHQLKVLEQYGTRIRILPSLSEPDDWHADKALVTSVQSAEAFVWDKEEGLIGTAVYCVPKDIQA